MLYQMPEQQVSIGFLVADVSRLLRHAFKASLEHQNSSLTQAQARALLYVSRNEGIRQVDLADLLEIQPITLARLIDLLVKAGLVVRQADPKDRRAYQLYLTQEADMHLNIINQVGEKIRAQALKGLDTDQAKLVYKALEQMRLNLTADSE
jgi:DNA-binding MarR family transcriptional regulator